MNLERQKNFIIILGHHSGFRLFRAEICDAVFQSFCYRFYRRFSAEPADPLVREETQMPPDHPGHPSYSALFSGSRFTLVFSWSPSVFLHQKPHTDASIFI